MKNSLEQVEAEYGGWCVDVGSVVVWRFWTEAKAVKLAEQINEAQGEGYAKVVDRRKATRDANETARKAAQR